ncbi:MAG: NAD(P)H-binding protein [Deltaproteobacteria bacterium]|nr:NAD(P)H-binding protein [Deltaproteobacteria bacterium]
MPAAFIAGATGYAGREVARALAARGDVRTVAHVRPDSPRLEEWRARLACIGVEVDATPWDAPLMASTLATLRPDLVFCLIGTTRARGVKGPRTPAGRPAETYETVDFGLTDLLARACVMAGVRPRFVYLSAAGTGPDARTAYGRARWKAEEAVRASGLPWTVARPAFVSGPDREERRILERAGAIVFDGLLGLAARIGAPGPRRRLASITASALASALVRAALDPAAEGRTLERADL